MEETCSRSGLPLWTRRRASTPKTKTGCLTCRQRRVKCDEAKPECLRCSKYGRECLGYQTNKTRHLRALRPAGPEKMLADDVLPSQPWSAPPVFNPQHAHYRAPRLIVPPGVTFVNEVEFRYFCYFRDETAAELSAGFDPSLWNQIVLQACDSRAILQLMTAVAALSLANRSGNQDVQASDRDENNQYAFQQYGEGLRNMREAVVTSSDSVRTFLIGTLLIFCFEGLQDNSVGAIVHISSALDIVLNHISAEPEKYRYSRLRAPRTRVDTGINDQVIIAYVRLETKSLPIQNHNVSYFEPRIAPILFANTNIEIPTCFGTIPEARLYLEAIKRQAPPYTERPKFAMRGSQGDVNQLEISEMESFGVTLDKCYDEGPGPVTDGQLTRWHDAFSPLMRYAMSSAGEPIFIGAVTLYVQALAENLQACQTNVEPSTSASVSQPASPGSPYNHNIDGSSNAHVIVALCHQLIGHQKFNKGFVFDIGIIPSVAKIFATSPEYSLREEAVEILRLMRPRREAFWDSRALTEIAEGLLSEREIFNGSGE